jgi:hypothetical protein
MLSSVLFEFLMLNIDFLEAKSQNSHGKKLLIVRSLLIIQRLLSCGQNDSRAMLSLSLRGFADLVPGRGWAPLLTAAYRPANLGGSSSFGSLFDLLADAGKWSLTNLIVRQDCCFHV